MPLPSKSPWTKARGVLLGPFSSLEDVPISEPALVLRSGIWEEHGDAVEPTIRNIDNMLMGEPNFTGGTLHSHRPTDPDGLVAHSGVVAIRVPSHQLKGFPSDYANAYNQVPNVPSQQQWSIIAQYSPVTLTTVSLLLYAKCLVAVSPPLNPPPN